jgi:hypothetical protein
VADGVGLLAMTHAARRRLFYLTGAVAALVALSVGGTVGFGLGLYAVLVLLIGVGSVVTSATGD